MRDIFKGNIAKAVKYLASVQQANGSFISFSSPDPNGFSHAIPFSTIFSSALILSCLDFLDETKQLNKIKRKLADFLLSQKSEKWTWNYWQRESDEAKAMPYPDDLDDTFCSLSTLSLYDRTLITPEVLGNMVHTLIICESKTGGPYKTWIVSENDTKLWQDVDIAVNANICYFLSLQSISLPNFIEFFDKAIQTRTFSSPYYPFPYPICYFLSRFYGGKQKNTLIAYIFALQNKQKNWDNSLHTALAVTSLLNLGVAATTLGDAVDYLLHQQAEDGSWLASAFYTGVNPKKDTRFFAGSSALTTAICIETLSKLQMMTKDKPINQKKIQQERIQEMILSRKEHLSKELSSYLQTQLSITVEKLIEKDTKMQITLLPYYFSQCLSQKDKKMLSEKFLVELGFANLLGWIAYTIYDNFLDDEGNTTLLSLANVCLRKLTDIFLTILPNNKAFIAFFHETMNALDAANTWEVLNCRLCINKHEISLRDIKLPDYQTYEKLSQKSFGHALGPFAILFAHGYTKDSPHIALLVKFFHHYLIAKQLNDDAHDVFTDLGKGFCTPVVAMLLQQYRNTYPRKNKIALAHASLKNFFWESTINSVCEEIFSHCAAAKTTLKKLSILPDISVLLALINSLENAAEKALEERRKTQEFLTYYQN